MNMKFSICAAAVYLSLAAAAAGQQFDAPAPAAGDISGTVTDVMDNLVPAATVVLRGSASGSDRKEESGDNGGFNFGSVSPGGPYRVTISAPGYADWTSAPIDVRPGQFVFLARVRMIFSGGVTSVTVRPREDQIATEQVETEEHQRVLGIVPNFYVVYDRHPAPMTAGLKFSLALKAATDPVTFLGAATIAAVDQAADTPDYVEGAKGFGQRYGANYLNGLTDIMLGGAILPSILHQDPRYFYQGTGSRRSRIFHALVNPFVCRGDGGRPEPNYSALGGYLASGAISLSYYPPSNRGAGLVLTNTGVDVAADMTMSLLQEFVLRKLTKGAGSEPH